MKLIYLSNSRIPTEKAHGVQIMNMCLAFARQGNEVTLIIPRRRNKIVVDPFVYYGIEPVFSIKYISTIDVFNFSRFGFLIQSFAFAINASIVVRKMRADIVYGRDEYSMVLIALFTKIKCIFEAHMGRWNFVFSGLMKYSGKLIVISNGLKKYFIEHGVDENKILVAPDAVDLDIFTVTISQSNAREKFGLPQDRKIVMYTGHLYDWKGVGILPKIASKLPAEYLLVVAGGISEDVYYYRNLTKNLNTIVYLGPRRHDEMPVLLRAADILILPNSGGSKISREYTSPMKLFEYMASNRVIIASDLPSLREILSDETAYFARPDDAEDFVRVINSVDKDGVEADMKARLAYEVVANNHTWTIRAQTILEAIL